MTFLAAVGLLTLTAVAVGATAAQHPGLAPFATESKPLVPVAQRIGAPRMPLDTRRPPIGKPGGPGIGVFIPPGLVPEKKPKIPAPVHCVAAEKVGTVEVTPMSQLPPPGICSGKQMKASKYVVGGGVPPLKNYEVVTTHYCVSCKYAGDFVLIKGWQGPNYGPDGLEKLSCFRCSSNYVWSTYKNKCCNNPNE
jgi:hypothetical protein